MASGASRDSEHRDVLGDGYSYHFWVWVWDWVHTPPFTQYPSPSRSLVRDGQTQASARRMTVSAGNVIPSKNNIPGFCRHRVDTSHFLIFTTRVGLKTKTKRGEIAFFQKAGILFSGGYDISAETVIPHSTCPSLNPIPPACVSSVYVCASRCNSVGFQPIQKRLRLGCIAALPR